jgi:hypothetical protein
MKRWVMTACALWMGASLSYGSGLGLFVSQWSPDEREDTVGGGAKLEFGGDVLGLELRGSYFDEDLVTIIPADVGLVLHLPLGDTPVGIYGMAGASWYFLDADNFDVDDKVGWYAGGGLKVALGNGIALFAEAQYRSLEYSAADDDIDELDENDVEFSAMTYNGGLLFEF